VSPCCGVGLRLGGVWSVMQKGLSDACRSLAIEDEINERVPVGDVASVAAANELRRAGSVWVTTVFGSERLASPLMPRGGHGGRTERLGGGSPS
jgi:hypothetical protein